VADRAEFHKAVDGTLTVQDILLYDAAGWPIIRTSELRSAAETELRAEIHKILDAWLDGIRVDKMPTSPEDMAEHLKKKLCQSERHTFDIVDGKLSLPISFTLGQLKIKAHVPFYRLAAIAFGAWLVYKKTEKSKPPPHAPLNASFSTMAKGRTSPWDWLVPGPSFSGRTWGTKETGGLLLPPGANFWSNDTSVVNVAADGLHLRIVRLQGEWQCAGVYLTEPLGYGTYTVQVASRLDQLGNTVATPLFIFADPAHELDIAYSGPGRFVRSPYNAHFAVQPATHSGNIVRYVQPRMYSRGLPSSPCKSSGPPTM
jgi:hypothetical protein